MRTAIQIQKSVVFAFFIRELKTRFGNYRLGYLWALLEPLGHVLVITVIFGALGRRTMPGIDYPLFIITGLFPFLFFRHVWTRSAEAVNSNRALLAYRYVQPLDNIWARVLLELLIFIAGFVVYLIGVAAFGIPVLPHRPLEVLCAYALLFIFAIGVGIVSGVVSAMFPEVKKCIPFITRPLYFISGVFIPLSVVPEQYRGWLLWNPILHALELAREFYFPSFQNAGATWYYLGLSAMVSLCFGLALYRLTRFKLLES
ncbi:MAG: ABC transporter permease [Geobacter sp.]|nr:MAG: ABC transporter permease [Geobacter sp.]